MPDSAIDFQPEQDQIDFQPEDATPPPVTMNARRGGSSGILPPVTMGARRGGTQTADIPPPLPPLTWKDYMGGAVGALTEPAPGAESGIPSLGPQVAMGAKEVSTPGQRGIGALRLGSAAMEAATPVMGPQLMENPLAVGRGLLEGEVASKGTGYVAGKLGATPAQKQAAENIAFLAPGIARSVIDPRVNVASTPEGSAGTVEGFGGRARAGVAITPDAVTLAGGLGSKTGRISIPRTPKSSAQPAIEPPTIEGQVITRAEAADYMDRAGWDPDKARALAAQERAKAPESQVSSAPRAGSEPAVVTRPTASVAPKPAAPAKIDFQPEVQSANAQPTRVPAGQRGVAQAAGKTERAATPATSGRNVESGMVHVPSGTEADQGRTSGALQPKHILPTTLDAVETKPVQEVASSTEREQPAKPETIPVQPVSQSGKESPEPKYKHGSTQANIPSDSEAAKALETARQRISPADLAGDGKDIGTGGNHLTVRYGLKGDDTEGVRKYLSSLSPFEATLGKTDKFPPSEHSDGAAVIHAPVEAPELHQINKELEQHGDFAESSFGEYKPHATVAYVKPENADRYVGMSATAGKKFTVNSIAITDRNGKQTEVPLDGKAGGEVAFEPERTLSEKPTERQKLALPPKPGEVGQMNVRDIKTSAGKFQYKLSTDAEGVGTLLKETKVFNPDLAGVVSVWRDSTDGKTYVVNGHHRYELARRTGQKTMAVRHIIAADAAEARAVGARQNIGEGRGTPVDAAKFFRDTSVTPEDLDKHGISLGEATAAKGLALSKLDTPIFNRVVQGDLSLGRAVAIGESTSDPAEQKAILGLVERKERSGAKVSDGTLSELIRLVKGSQRTTETTADLFGSQEITRSMALEKAEISDHIKQQLSKDKKLFGFVAKEGRATELARAGNKIDVEKSKEISTGAAQAEEVYNKLSSRGGPISGILDESARRLADGENAGTVKSEAYQRVRAEVSKTLGNQEGTVSEGLEKGAGRSEAPERPAGKSETAVEPTLPGMEHVPAERAEASAEQQGKDLTEKLTEPPKSVERAAGEIEQKSPLFRDTEANPQGGLFGGESGSFNPSKLAPAAIKKTYTTGVEKFISEKLKIGDKYYTVKQDDPAVAEILHEVDNAPLYYRNKAKANLEKVTKGLTPDQIRLTSLLVDSDSRDYLRQYKRDEYSDAVGDTEVMAAVERFKPLQEELTRDRMALGWPVRKSLTVEENKDAAPRENRWIVKDRDGNPVADFKSEGQAIEYVDENATVEPHLKRTYPEHMRSPLPADVGGGPFTGTFYADKGLRPPRMDKKARLASAEYHYQHGAKDFSGYPESFAKTKEAVLKQHLFDKFTDKATAWRAGTAQPPTIIYNGKKYTRPDIVLKAKHGGANLEAYGIYDPSRGERFLIKTPTFSTLATGKPGIGPNDRFLAPKRVVDALEKYDATRGGEGAGKLRKFFQEQIVGLFGPVVHVNNILRHAAQATGALGTFDPRSWPTLQKIIFSADVRKQVLKGLDDSTIDMLSRGGSYTDWSDIGNLNAYIGGNLNPINWIRSFGKGVLFNPKFAGGWGGLDPKARAVIADFLKDHVPGITDPEIRTAVEDGFGNYNRKNWTERQRMIAKFTLFPGWDAASFKWFLRHPFLTAMVPAAVMLALNLAMNALGKNKDQDKYDFSYLHYGDRKFRSGLITDSMASHIAEPVLAGIQAAIKDEEIGAAVGEGFIRGAGSLAGTLLPEIQLIAEQLFNRKFAGSASEIVSREDKNIPGKVLPNRDLEKRAIFAALKIFPAVGRFLAPDQTLDWKTGVGSAFGITNYKYGAEERLKANTAKAMGYSQTLSTLGEREPEAAEKFVADPNKAVYLMFNGDLTQMEKDLKEIGTEKEKILMADGIPEEDRKEAIKSLDDAKVELLNSADALNDQLTDAKLQLKQAQ